MKINSGLTLGLAMTVAIVAGCSGGDTDGGTGAVDHTGDVFVSTDSTTGTIAIDVDNDDFPVGETIGFHVYVKNADGQPVRQIGVSCDSEKGLAILEPTKGTELTDDTGQMSGRVGCERRGSLQLACRLTTGANKRTFHTFKCRGDVPAGFAGFPGASGGGLGGGVQVGQTGDVRITSVGFQDDGNLSTSGTSVEASIDAVQKADCDVTTAATEVEPFFDTYINVTVENNLTEKVRFSYLTYEVPHANSRGQSFSSQRLGLTQESSSTIDANGDVKTIVLPIFKASGGKKYFGNPPGSGTAGLEISPTLGLQTVIVTLVGQTSSGKTVEVSGSVTGSFSNFNRCTTGG